MARRALIVVAIGLLGLALGAVVAGRPDDVPSDVVSARLPEITSTTAPSTATSSATTAAAAPPATVAPAPTTTAPPTTSQSSSTTTSVPTPPTTPPPVLVPEGEIRLVVANATDAPGLAARTAAELRALGYTDSVSTDAVASRPDTVIFYLEGLSAEALRLARQIGLDQARVELRGTGQLTRNDAGGEVWLLLGADN